jgi:hypothetical protein
MPEFEVYTTGYGDSRQSEMTIKPSCGDLRVNTSGTLEKMDDHGNWNFVGHLDGLFSSIVSLESLVYDINNWKLIEQTKYETTTSRSELEADYDDLRKAGDHLAIVEEQAKMAKNHLKLMDNILKDARESYRALKEYTKQKQKTFDIVNTDHEAKI